MALGADFFFDKYPIFAVGCSDHYDIADEGFGVRPLPPIRGHLQFSQHLCRSLVYDEFDITVCQEMRVEHDRLTQLGWVYDGFGGYRKKAASSHPGPKLAASNVQVYGSGSPTAKLLCPPGALMLLGAI